MTGVDDRFILGVRRRSLERIRWPRGPRCPFCNARKPYRLAARATSKRGARDGLLKCRACRKQFTVTTQTQFHDTHLRADQLLLAHRLMLDGKPLLEISRRLGISYKTAWMFGKRWRMAGEQLFVTINRQSVIDRSE